MRTMDISLRRYVAAVSVVGLTSLVAVVQRGPFPRDPGYGFWILAVLVVVGEFLPVPFLPRSGGGATTSTGFAFAILVGWGLPAAVMCLAAASVCADVAQRRAWYKAIFNAAQYALSMVAAGLAVEAIHGSMPLIVAGHAGFGEVAVLVPAALAYFVVNNVLTGVVVGLAEGSRVLPQVLDELRRQTLNDPVLIALSPVFVIVTQTTPAVLPGLLVPVFGVYLTNKLSLQKEYQALHDGLTGLPNRTMFRTRLGEDLAKIKSGDRAALLLIDLDGFKEVNDTLGHATGDRLLQILGPRLLQLVRGEDVMARLGGDEFVAYVAHIDDEAATVDVAERIREAVSEPFDLDGVSLFIEASVGIAVYPDDGTTVGTLLRHADVAMYLAKQDRAGWARWSQERDVHSLSRLTVLSELRDAIHGEELVLHYQAKSEPTTGTVCGVEALVRWHHPERGLLYPVDFLALAERSGLIVDLTDRVLEDGVTQALRWEADGLRMPVAANLSVRNLDDPHLPERIAGLLSHLGARPDSLSLELTESMVMADPAGALRVLTPLSEMGVHISIDDFGTGYSSLAYLTQLPISEIKIDRSFMERILVSTNDAIVVRSTIDLAHDLGLTVVAEGVESEAVLAMLAGFGCDLVQGYFVQRPVPEAEFTTWFRSLTPH
jgi:diguanylate cyclase (GGDEF)-like protein